MFVALGQIVLLLMRGAAALLMLRLGQLARVRVRRLILPAVPRKNWSAEDERIYAAGKRREDHADTAPGSHVWQMHRALERLSADAAAMAGNLTNWRTMLADLDRQQEACAREAQKLVETGQKDEVTRLLLDGRRYERGAVRLRSDIERVDSLLLKCRADMAELETRIGDELRQTAVADARLTAARDILSARQAARGPLAEAAVTRREQLEREADRIEAEAEALALGQRDEIGEAFAQLEAESAAEHQVAVARFGRKRA